MKTSHITSECRTDCVNGIEDSYNLAVACLMEKQKSGKQRQSSPHTDTGRTDDQKRAQKAEHKVQEWYIMQNGIHLSGYPAQESHFEGNQKRKNRDDQFQYGIKQQWLYCPGGDSSEQIRSQRQSEQKAGDDRFLCQEELPRYE